MLCDESTTWIYFTTSCYITTSLWVLLDSETDAHYYAFQVSKNDNT